MNSENHDSWKELSIFEGGLPLDEMYPADPSAAAPTDPVPTVTPQVLPNLFVREQYEQHVYRLKKENTIVVIIGLILTCLLVTAMFELSSDGSNWIVVECKSGIMYYIGFILLGIIWYVTGKIINTNRNAQNGRKRQYQEQYPGDDFFAGPERKRWIGGRIIVCCCIVAIIARPITLQIVEARRLNLVCKKYDEAVSLVDSGAYQEAKTLFEEIENEKYRDTTAYIHLCEAHILQEEGDITAAYLNVTGSAFKFTHLTQEQEITIVDYVLELRGEWFAYQRKLEEEKAEEERKERERAAFGPPYVGMPESELENTILGGQTYQRLRDYEIIDGERCVVNIYYFESGFTKTFTVWCANGEVIRVQDHRKRKETQPSSSAKKQTTKKTQDDDPYDVNDYYYAEDFYDEHYDDFFDYYDAENYFNEHHE